MLELFFPRYTHKALKCLGMIPWFYCVENKQGKLEIQHKNLSLADLPPDMRKEVNVVRLLLSSYSNDPVSVLYTQTVATSLAQGPKVFQPTFAQCLALEQTEVNVGFDFYQQPYKAIIIEIPDEYREYIKSEHDSMAPRYVLLYRHERRPGDAEVSNGMLAVTAYFGPDNVIVNTMSNRYETIEEALISNRKTNGGDAEFHVAELVQRLGINFALLMTMQGVVDKGPLNPAEVARQKKNLTSSKPGKAEQAVMRLLSVPHAISLKQEIKLFEVQRKTAPKVVGEESEGTERNSPIPHWRKGHFKMQPYGPKNTLRKLRHISALFVMSEYFSGDLGDTEVLYKVMKEKQEKKSQKKV